MRAYISPDPFFFESRADTNNNAYKRRPLVCHGMIARSGR